jgi:hypothetical protein
MLTSAALVLLLAGCGGGPAGQGGGKGSGGGGGSALDCNVMSLGQGAGLNGFKPFPTNNPWNTDISAAPVDPNSDAIINFIGPTIGLHPDFGTGGNGIPYVVVSGSQNNVAINFTAYGDESDPGPMPVPANAPIEGGSNSTGDRHVLVLDNANCFLYEMGRAFPNSDGSWDADVAVVWDLLNNQQRPWTWTSVDAAGLPIFPGLARYDEVAAGQIQHALRFTLQKSRQAMVPPASHWAANNSNSLAAPMGMRIRLKANYDISHFSAKNQVILTALKKYGLIMADNGSSMYITGAPDNRWDDSDLHNLGQVTTSNFEVVEMNPIYTPSNIPHGSPPSISSFTATPGSGAGTTLNWSVTGASYLIISPAPGPVRGTTLSVSPTHDTTYTLYATNQYGQSSATVVVHVP